MAGIKRGIQIFYVPTHAEGDLSHPDVEAGFVTSVKGDTVFCRYWRKDLTELRTKSNSEGTPKGLLIIGDSVPQIRVDVALSTIEAEQVVYHE